MLTWFEWTENKYMLVKTMCVHKVEPTQKNPLLSHILNIKIEIVLSQHHFINSAAVELISSRMSTFDLIYKIWSLGISLFLGILKVIVKDINSLFFLLK